MAIKMKSVPVRSGATLKKTALVQAGRMWNKQDFFGHGTTKVCHSSQEAAESYGLNWEVCLTHIKSVTTGLSAPKPFDTTSRDPRFDQIQFMDNRGVLRMDTLAPMGTVGTGYHIIQNVDAMAIFDQLARDRKLELFSGGWFLEGQQCYATIKLPGSLKIAGEEITMYIVLTWSHDGTYVWSANFVPYLHGRKISLASLTKDNIKSKIDIRHTKNAHERIKLGGEVYVAALRFFEGFSETLKEMASTTLTMDKFGEILEFLYPENGERKTKEGKRIRSGDEKKRAGIMQAWDEVPPKIRETEFGAFLAMCEYSDHHGRTVRRRDKNTGQIRRTEEEIKLHSSLFGAGSKIKERSMKTLLNFDEIKSKAEEARKRRDKTKKKETTVL